MGAWLQFSLLFVCWLAALATLLVFLESWFALADRNRFAARRASGAYGVVTVFIPMRGSIAKLEQTIRSVFNQSYPFIELVLIHSEDEGRYSHLAKEFRSARSHIPVRIVATPFPIDSQNDRTRALEQAVAAGVRGRWFVVIEPDVILDRFAVESALEFAGSNEVSALALRPGVQCTALIPKLLAPSMEYLLQMIRVIDGRREKGRKLSADTSFLILNREAFDVVNRINRMPGILNDSGWNVWSYQVEGLRTFEGDGSRWMWREAEVRMWGTTLQGLQGLQGDLSPEWRARGFVAGSAVMALISIAGLLYGFTHRIENFAGASILSFSAVSYTLMGISYYLYARRLRAAGWFAPLWFLAHIPAAILTLLSANSKGDRPRTSAPTSQRKTSATGPHY